MFARLAFLCGLACLWPAFLSLAAPVLPDPEIAASQRIAVLHQQYQQNTLNTIAAATTGCTTETISRRKEW